MTKFTPWWQSGDALQNRLNKINSYRDTTTSADEMLRMARLFLTVLLAFSGVLAGMNYFLFFSHTLPFEFSLLAAALLTITIEWGKSRMGLRALQKPFLEGFQVVFSTPAQTIMWIGTVAFAVATFTMSVLNSTKGGEAMAAKMGREKHEMQFQADTRFFDDQIAQATAISEKHSANTYKGNIVYESAKVVKRQSALIERLNTDRQKAIEQQRADWERKRDAVEGETSTAASMVLKAGGWVEGLQLLLIVIIGACQKVLADRMEASPTLAQQPKRGIGFSQPAQAMAHRESSNPTGEERRSIGFQYANRDVPAEARLQQDSGVSVSHVTQPVAQQSGGNASIGAGDALMAIRTALMRDVRNLETGNGFPETILKRVEAQLWRAIELYNTPGFSPEAQKRTLFEAYVTGVFEPKMIALEADAETKDKQHYSFIRVQRTDSLLSKIVPQA